MSIGSVCRTLRRCLAAPGVILSSESLASGSLHWVLDQHCPPMPLSSPAIACRVKKIMQGDPHMDIEDYKKTIQSFEGFKIKMQFSLKQSTSMEELRILYDRYCKISYDSYCAEKQPNIDTNTIL